MQRSIDMDSLCFLIIFVFIAAVWRSYADYVDSQTMASIIGLSLVYFVAAGIPYSIAAIVLGFYLGWTLLQKFTVQISAEMMMAMAASMVAALIGLITIPQKASQSSDRFLVTLAREKLLDRLRGISHTGIFPIIFSTSLQ